MNNNVLIISYSYPPTQAPAAQRPFYLAKYINKEKWQVSVLTPKTSDSSMGYAKSVESIEDVQMIYTGNINISSLRRLKDIQKKDKQQTQKIYISRILKQKIYSFLSSVTIPDKGIVWVPFAIVKALKVVKHDNIQVIFTTSPLFSNHLVGLVLKKWLKVQWVADFRDFHYVENYEKTKLKRRHADRWLEKSVINSADKVLFIAESMKDEYCKHYPALKEKSYAVYNGFEPELELKIDTIPQKQHLTIFYAGSFYAGERSPSPLLLILDKLIEKGSIDTKDIQIRIAGNVEESIVQDMAQYKVFESVEFLGLIPRQQVLEEIRSSHLLWLIVGNTKKHYMGFPIKGYEYIAAQRKILAFVPSGSEADHIITKYNLGYVMSSKVDGEPLEKNITLFGQIIDKYKRSTLNEPLELNDDLLSLSKRAQFSKIEEIMESMIL